MDSNTVDGALRGVVVLLAAGLAACEFPTEPPVWNQTWIVPVERVEIGVTELLPAGVTLNGDSTAFVAETPAASVSLSLAELCGTPCVLAAGLRAPKPEFSDTLTTETRLPDDLVSAMLSDGSFDATIGHSFSFDPLRPSSEPSAERGHIVVRITSAGNVIASDSIDGAEQAFPESVTLTPSLPVQPVQVSDTVVIEVALFSPEGDSTTISVSDTAGLTFAPATVEIAEVTVVASDLAVDSVNTTMTFGGIDSTALDRVQSGALRFDVRNPFAVTGTLDMSFSGGFPTIRHRLDIREGDHEERLDFSGDEVREILRSDNVQVLTSGQVAAADGTITVAPPDVMILDSEFEIVVQMGTAEDP